MDPAGPVAEGPSAARVLAAVINYEQVELTVATIASILAAVSRPHELLVIDNGSSEAGRRGLRARLPNHVELITLPANGGFGLAGNVAIREAIQRRADYVWVLNNDLYVKVDPLPALCGVLDEDPLVAAAAPVTVDVADGRTVLGAGVDVRVARGRARHRYEGTPVSSLPTHPYTVDALEGACMLMRVSAIASVGGFDEGFFMYWEDTEWSVRARRAGYRLVVVPGSRVAHHVSMSSTPARRTALLLRNRVRFVRACGTAVEQLAFLAYYTVGWLPAYTVARLVPRFGLTRGLALALASIGWNVRDARRQGWSLKPQRASIPTFRTSARKG